MMEKRNLFSCLMVCLLASLQYRLTVAELRVQGYVLDYYIQLAFVP